jgi:hypothetical protein
MTSHGNRIAQGQRLSLRNHPQYRKFTNQRYRPIAGDGVPVDFNSVE